MIDLWSPIARRVHRHEPLRSGLRAGVAALAGYGVALAVGADQTWLVISALFVQHTTVGSTVRSALGRVGGALLGVGIGLVLLLLLGSGGWRSAIGLAAGAAALAAVSERWPRLAYGLVTVAVVLLQGGGPDWGDTFGLALAIALGSGIGALVGAAVFPASAHAVASQHIAAAARGCADIVRIAADAGSPDRGARLKQLHETVRANLAAARESVRVTWPPGHDRADALAELLRRLDRLWHTLFVIDRLGGTATFHAPDGGGRAARTGADVANFLEALADALAQGQTVPDQTALDRLKDTAERWPSGQFAWSLAWRQIGKDLKALRDAAAQTE